jgi:hypothetical protein
MGTAHPNLTTGHTAADRDTFLSYFPTTRRSFVANWFLNAVRHGMRTPSTVLAYVEAELDRAQAWVRHWSDDSQERYDQLAAAIAEHRTEALAFSCWALRWETLTPEQKRAHRAQGGEQYARAWMEQQPATERQLAFLRALGHTAAVESRQEASDLIEQLRRAA